MTTFEEFADLAAGVGEPYDYQRRLADHGLPDVLRVPTGSGKTMAAVLPWLYRRVAHPDPTVRAASPRWLVVVLPQRALVEQTTEVIRGWVENLGMAERVGAHVLMGGESTEDRVWKTSPENERILIGTQDMVLSRLLMRGYAEGRASWPVSFGLLHSGVQFVFDEVQLMGPGLPTSLQLQGLREALGTAIPCRSMWMSATLDPGELYSVDLTRPHEVVELDESDRAGPLRTRLEATRRVRRLELDATDAAHYPSKLGDQILAAHRPGTRTLVVLNTVQRALATYDALQPEAISPEVVLLHSRFRPDDRATQTNRALTKDLGAEGLIVVTTQVLEAGIDVTSDTLVTETAPWSSIVQRAGRCNRDGRAHDAQLLWTPPPSGKGNDLPYDQAEHDNTAEVLSGLEGHCLTSSSLTAAGSDVTRPLHPVLRRRELLDLFDTSPDLTGNDIDVTPYIRDATERTVSLAWRAVDAMDSASQAASPPGRRELCPAPIGEVVKLVDSASSRARILDQLDGRWRAARKDDVRPGAMIVLDAARGAYLPERGFALTSNTPVPVVAEPAAMPDGVDTDPHSLESRWVPLREHLEDVERTAEELLGALGGSEGLSAQQRDAIILAGRYHDLGKAHPTFQESLRRVSPSCPPDSSDGPWAKSCGRGRLDHRPPHFRHELVSALLLADEELGLLDTVDEAWLITYLVQAHHGKVRMTLRARPDEAADTLLGVEDGRSTIEAILPSGEVVPARPISLRVTRFGSGSLTSRTLALRDRSDLGPFRLAFCEAVLRAADWRASAKYDHEERQ